MTPIAHYIAKQLTLPVRERTLNDPWLFKAIENIHCFEVTEVHRLACDLALVYFDTRDLPTETLFLPAPTTWIEFASPGTWQRSDIKRIAVRLTEDASTIYYTVIQLCVEDRIEFTSETGALGKTGVVRGDSEGATKVLITAYLALINSPRTVGRRQIAPHRELERRLARSIFAGKFPLQGYTEITLRVTATVDAIGQPPTEAHYTGKKALHFCRSHGRELWNGKRIIIPAHWRGTAALGIKRSRYRVTHGRLGETV